MQWWLSTSHVTIRNRHLLIALDRSFFIFFSLHCEPPLRSWWHSLFVLTTCHQFPFPYFGLLSSFSIGVASSLSLYDRRSLDCKLWKPFEAWLDGGLLRDNGWSCLCIINDSKYLPHIFFNRCIKSAGRLYVNSSCMELQKISEVYDREEDLGDTFCSQRTEEWWLHHDFSHECYQKHLN